MKKISRKYTTDDYLNVTVDDDDTMVGIKEKLGSLRQVERDIFLTYVNEGSYAAVAEKYNVSAPTAKTYINKIKDKFRFV